VCVKGVNVRAGGIGLLGVCSEFVVLVGFQIVLGIC